MKTNTLYRHFPSKTDLVAAYLTERHERVIHSLTQRLVPITDPRQQIVAIFDVLYEKADNPDFRGCAFSLAVAEHRDSQEVVKIAREHKAAIRAIIHAAVASGDGDTEGAAAHISLLYEGALATVAVDQDRKAVLLARECALAVFDITRSET